MTLIASFTSETQPILFGDMLLSGVSTPDLSLPAFGPHHIVSNSGQAIYGLAQKISIISPNLTVAVAGDFDLCKRAVEHLQNLGKVGSFSAEVIDKFFEDRKLLLRNISLLGYITGTDSNGHWFLRFQHNGLDLISRDFDDVIAAGTGVKDLTYWLNYGILESFEGTTHSTKDRAIIKSLTLAGLQLRAEHANGAPIIEALCGGAYEIAYMDDGCFVKLDDVTYVVWDAEVLGNEVNFQPPFLIMRQIYVGDVAIIKSARFDLAKNDKFKISHRDWKVVLPIYKTALDVPLPLKSEVSLQSRISCHIFLVTNGDQRGLMCKVQLETEDRSFYVDESLSDLGVRANINFLKTSANIITTGSQTIT